MMKKTKSKVLSIFLCLCMIFPYMSGFSMLADADDSAEFGVTQLTVDMLSKLDSSSLFSPDDIDSFRAVGQTGIQSWTGAPEQGRIYVIFGTTESGFQTALFNDGQFISFGGGRIIVKELISVIQGGMSYYFTYSTAPSKAAVKTAPQPNDLTYSGESQALVSAGEAEVGTMQYQLGTNAVREPDGTWTDTVPEQTDAGNYFVWYRAYVDDTNISKAGCITVQIAPKAVKVSGIAAEDIAYNGKTDVVFDYSKTEFDGIVEGDKLTVTAAGSFEDANAGEDKTVNITALTLGGESAANYVLAETGNQTTAKAEIFKRAVVVTRVLAQNKLYDGTTEATMVTGFAEFGNMIEGDTLTVEATGEFADASVGKDKIVNITSLTLGGASAANYFVSPLGTQTATTASITIKVVTVSGITANNKVYDGTTAAALDCSNAVFDGMADGDELTVSAVGNFEDANVGENKTVIISDMILGGANAGDYALALTGVPATTTAGITRKAVTVSGITANDKVYDKNAEASLIFDNAVFDGIVKGDTLSVTAKGEFADVNAGENKTVNISDLVLVGASVDNYALALQGNQQTTSATIIKKDVTVNGIAAADKFYDATTAASFDTNDAVFDGLISGDTLTVTAAGDFEDELVGTDKTVTISAFTLGGASAANYAVASTGSQTTSIADIEKRLVIVAPDSQTVTIGGEIDTSLDKVITLNFVEGHTLAAATIKSTSTAFVTNEGIITVSDAVIKCGDTDVTSNYGIIYLDGYLTVTEKDFIVRIEGSNRYETAAAISAKYMGSADTVVLASGLNYADALAGVPLATKLNAPLLLTSDKELHASTLAEIKRLGAKKVVILGGEGAVSEAVEKALQAENLETERVSGKTRYSTATSIAEKLNENPTDIFFVYANNYPDALSVSSVAAAKNAPIIYLSTDGNINADTAAYLAKLKEKKCVKNAYVIGGEGVISGDMVKQAAAALGTGTITRICGNNRFLTCIEINKKFADIFSGESICVATGAAFPDALAGGVFAAQKKIPMILAAGKLSDEQKAYLGTVAAENIYVLGGTGAVPDDLAKQIAGAVKVPN